MQTGAPKAFAHFKTKEQSKPELIAQLGADGRGTYMTAFFQNIVNVSGNAQTAEEIILGVSDLLERQMDGNPPFYVSHAADHGVRVAMYAPAAVS